MVFPFINPYNRSNWPKLKNSEKDQNSKISTQNISDKTPYQGYYIVSLLNLQR